MKKPVLVVLAAGMGSRYGGLKQMDGVGVNGQSIVDYSVYDARRAGFETVVFIIKREIEADFRRQVGDRIAQGMEVRYAFQEQDDLPEGYSIPAGRKKPWGTAHAVLAARDVIDGPFAVINADDYYGPGAYQAIYDYLTAHPDSSVCSPCAMVGYRLGNTLTENGGVTRAVCHMGEDGFLQKVVEHHSIQRDGADARFPLDDGETWGVLSGDTTISMNFWGFQRSFLDQLKVGFPGWLDQVLRDNPEKGEVFLPWPITDLIRSGSVSVKVLTSSDRWFGVTYREDREAVAAALAKLTEQGLYPENLWDQ